MKKDDRNEIGVTKELDFSKPIKFPNGTIINFKKDRFASTKGKKRTNYYLKSLSDKIKEVDKSDNDTLTCLNNQIETAKKVEGYITYPVIHQNKIMMPLNACQVNYIYNDEPKVKIILLDDDSIGEPHELPVNFCIVPTRDVVGSTYLGKKVGDEVLVREEKEKIKAVIKKIIEPNESKWMFKADLLSKVEIASKLEAAV